MHANIKNLIDVDSGTEHLSRKNINYKVKRE